MATGIATLAMSAGLFGAAVAPASAAGCTTYFRTYSTVSAGTTGSQARAVECLLHEAGYATTQNSSLSSSDVKKLKQFQGRHSLRATGRTNGATWSALIAQGPRPTLQPGDRGPSVRRLQLALRALGHTELPGTTYYGPRTEAAVKALQGRAGLSRTGNTSPTVWSLLQNGSRKAAGGTSGSVRRSSARSSGASKGDRALAFAKKQLGEPYQFGAAGPSRWDCSGLTMKAWAAAGVRLPHLTTAQYRKGKSVRKADLRKGDLVFFYSGVSHVGIYAGGGKVIHAPRPGSRVSYIKMAYMPWKGARRFG